MPGPGGPGSRRSGYSDPAGSGDRSIGKCFSNGQQTGKCLKPERFDALSRGTGFRITPERRATRQLTLGKIDSRLGGPRTDAKAAPEEEKSHYAKGSVAVARS